MNSAYFICIDICPPYLGENGELSQIDSMKLFNLETILYVLNEWFFKKENVFVSVFIFLLTHLLVFIPKWTIYTYCVFIIIVVLKILFVSHGILPPGRWRVNICPEGGSDFHFDGGLMKMVFKLVPVNFFENWGRKWKN